MKKLVTKKTRRLTGIIVSDKMDKTVVVSVSRERVDSKYGKRFNFHKKFKAHDETNAYHIGDKVVIEETRPVSKDKNWKVVEKISYCSVNAINSDSKERISSGEADSVKNSTSNEENKSLNL